ncbi:MAG TPA: MlaD family protein [Chthoniobacterales bacterium]|jgi:phospholipid/cholesterol/gamma-HCH transport system substrate-binding protein|nr:MlaD family protein [Chthoniobacterales bacterium]
MATRHSEKGLELKVGAFVLVGLGVLAFLLVQFGRLGEGFQSYYQLLIKFPDASGLLKGSDVLLAGAKIGHVSGGPRLAPSGQGVEVPVRIFGFVKIPAGSRFTVGSSGLLGDRFVAVTAPQRITEDFVPKNSVIEGTRDTGLDDLTKEGGALVEDLRTAVQNANAAIEKLNNEALSQANLDNIKSAVANLNTATTALAGSTQKIDGVLDKASETMDSAKKAADDLPATIADARKTIQAATETIQKASTGKGALATLLTNQDFANDLKALVSNLRAHGILFYRDSAAKEEARQPNPPRKNTRP